jgi:glycosyltransferase involved in cell wall biosynthesis
VDRFASSGQYDAAYIHLFRMAPYLAHHPGLYRVVDLTDVISKEVAASLPYRGAASRLLYSLERPRIAAYEKKVAEHFEESWLISGADLKVLGRRAPGANLQVVPNGVDLEQLRPSNGETEPDLLLFVGHMSVFHNVDAASFLAEEILPRVRRAVPACRVRLVGADPAPRVKALGELPGVTVAGFVPDLNAELNRAAVFVAPLRFAAGVQNKVLEALAAGRPVVTTRQVSEGLGATPGEHLLAGDDPGVLAALVGELLQDPDRARAIGEAGRLFVAQRFTWETARRRMKEIENLL